MSSDIVRELEALDAKATKGPWFMIGPPWNHETQYINAASADPHGGRIVCDFECQWDQDDGGDDSLAPRPLEDAATIVAIRNALPALIEYVKARTPETEAALLAALRGGK